jgi:hypothetical protein
MCHSSLGIVAPTLIVVIFDSRTISFSAHIKVKINFNNKKNTDISILLYKKIKLLYSLENDVKQN